VAFDALFERYKDYVYRVAYMTLRNSDDAEEATQETLSPASSSAGRSPPPGRSTTPTC
jgi:DNA-directed RNA polymerase specialized sigma24 family protein